MSEQLRAAAQAALDAWRQSPHIWQRSSKTLHDAFSEIESALSQPEQQEARPVSLNDLAKSLREQFEGGASNSDIVGVLWRAIAHPPQPDAQDRCVCGNPEAPGVEHRAGGPCYLVEPLYAAPPQPAVKHSGPLDYPAWVFALERKIREAWEAVGAEAAGLDWIRFYYLTRQALDTLPARADAQQTQGAEDERAAFEAWALRTIATDDDLKRGRLTGYASQELNYLWRGWSAHATTQQTAVTDDDKIAMEPAFTLKWRDDESRYVVDRPNIGTTECYTAEQVRAAHAAGVREGMARAAKVCKTVGYDPDNWRGLSELRPCEVYADAADECAAAIRQEVK